MGESSSRCQNDIGDITLLQRLKCIRVNFAIDQQLNRFKQNSGNVNRYISITNYQNISFITKIQMYILVFRMIIIPVDDVSSIEGFRCEELKIITTFGHPKWNIVFLRANCVDNTGVGLLQLL